MVYTRLGSELARVTVVNLKKEIVYDTLVKPKYPIECYNTQYSGWLLFDFPYNNFLLLDDSKLVETFRLPRMLDIISSRLHRIMIL